MFLTILNYYFFCCQLVVVHNTFHRLSLKSFAEHNTSLRTSFAHKKFVLTCHFFSRYFQRSFSIFLTLILFI